MKKSIFSLLSGGTLLIIILTSFSWVSPKQGSSPSHSIAPSATDHPALDWGRCYTENKTFQDGEKITYKLYYKKIIWIPAGEVVFSVKDNHDGTLHLSAKGRTYKSYEWFFKVRNSYECTIDKASLLPNNSLRQIQEGKHRRLYEKVNFDQDNRQAVSQLGCSMEQAKTNEIALEDCMHDLLSVLYYTRNINLDQQTVGARFPIKVFMDQNVHSLNLVYKGKKERKKIKGNGRFNTIHFRPESVPGRLFEKEKDKGKKMDIWVSDDENRLPLMIKTPLAGGQIKAILKTHEGLRHELKAKVK